MTTLRTPFILAASCVAVILAPAAAAKSPLIYSQTGVANAKRFARTRSGIVSFAVIDGKGRISGMNVRVQHKSASVSKAMLLVATLRRAWNRPLTTQEKALLRPMVTISDNNAASAVYEMVGGDKALESVAKLAHMQHFGPSGYWSEERLTAVDQARLFLHIDKLMPSRHRAYGMTLLASIVPYERWGIAPVAARHHMRIFFKGGWRTGITHQIALLEKGHRRISLAVMTTGEPSIPYGEQTIQGIAERVFG